MTNPIDNQRRSNPIDNQRQYADLKAKWPAAKSCAGDSAMVDAMVDRIRTTAENTGESYYTVATTNAVELAEEVDDRERAISSLRELVDSKDADIESKEEEIGELKGVIKELEGMNAAEEVEIAKLKAQLENQEAEHDVEVDELLKFHDDEIEEYKEKMLGLEEHARQQLKEDLARTRAFFLAQTRASQNTEPPKINRATKRSYEDEEDKEWDRAMERKQRKCAMIARRDKIRSRGLKRLISRLEERKESNSNETDNDDNTRDHSDEEVQSTDQNLNISDESDTWTAASTTEVDSPFEARVEDGDSNESDTSSDSTTTGVDAPSLEVEDVSTIGDALFDWEPLKRIFWNLIPDATKDK